MSSRCLSAIVSADYFNKSIVRIKHPGRQGPGCFVFYIDPFIKVENIGINLGKRKGIPTGIIARFRYFQVFK